MSGGWGTRASLAEGWAAVRDGGALPAALVGVVALVTAAALAADVVAAQRVVDAEAAYLAEGGDLLVARFVGDGASTEAAGAEAEVDAAACTRLGDMAGVRGAFALDVEPGGAQVVGRPEAQQTVVTATDDALDLLGVTALAPGEALVSSIVADRWLWATGSAFRLVPTSEALGSDALELTTAAVVDLGLLAEGASTGVLLPRAATGTTQTCYVRVEAWARDDVAAAVPAVLGETSDRPVQVAERLPAGAFARDPAADYDGRPTRWAGAAAGLVTGLLLAVVAWTRRGRAALYASVGVPWSGGVVLRWAESLLVVGAGVAWGTFLGATTAVLGRGADAALAVPLALRGGLAALAAATVVVVLVGLARPPVLASLKDRG